MNFKMSAPGRKTLLGYVLMVVYVIMFSMSSVAVQCLNRTVPDFQLGIFRYFGGALLAIVPVCYSGLSIKLPVHLLLPVLSLSFLSLIYNLLFYFAVSVLPLSHASSLSSVFQTIAMAIMLIVLFHEAGSLLMTTSLCGCTVGMVLVLQPWLSFNHGFTPGFAKHAMEENNSTFSAFPYNISSNLSVSTAREPGESFNRGLLLLGYLSVAVAGIVESATIIIVSRYLREVKPAMLVFCASSFCIVPQVLCWLYLEEPVLISDPYDMVLVMVHAMALGLGLMALNHACTLISPMQVSLVFNFGSVVNVILQYTILSGHLYGRRNVLEVLGCLLVTASITLSALSSDKNHDDFNV